MARMETAGNLGEPPGTDNAERENASPAAPLPEALGAELQLIGELLFLCLQSPLHRHYTIKDIQNRFLRPAQINHYRLYRDARGPLAIVTWALLSEALDARQSAGPEPLSQEDWQSGDHLWFTDFVAPFGQVETVMKDLTENLFPERRAKAHKRDASSGRWILKQYHGAKARPSRPAIEISNRGDRAQQMPEGQMPEQAHERDPKTGPAPARRITPPSTLYVLLGEIFTLLARVPEQADMRIGMIETRFLNPVRYDQLRIYRTPAGPLALVSWALLSDTALARISTEQPIPDLQDWRSGKHFRIIDLLARKSDQPAIVKDLKRLRKQVEEGLAHP